MKHHAPILFSLATAVVLIDQLTKLFATTALAHRGVVYLVKTDVISIFLTWSLNTNMAFSLPSALWLIILGTIAIIAGLGWWLYRKLKNGEQGIIPLTLLIAAAISNLGDRIFLHGVVDFLSFSIGNIHFAIFNVADVFITASIGVLLLQEYFQKKKPDADATLRDIT